MHNGQSGIPHIVGNFCEKKVKKSPLGGFCLLMVLMEKAWYGQKINL